MAACSPSRHQVRVVLLIRGELSRQSRFGMSAESSLFVSLVPSKWMNLCCSKTGQTSERLVVVDDVQSEQSKADRNDDGRVNLIGRWLCREFDAVEQKQAHGLP